MRFDENYFTRQWRKKERKKLEGSRFCTFLGYLLSDIMAVKGLSTMFTYLLTYLLWGVGVGGGVR